MSGDDFIKLYGSRLLTSSVWLECPETRCVWITLLALAGPDGVVLISPLMLARQANVSLDATEAALLKFQAPDPHSRNSDHDGQRIIAIPGGWQLLNYVQHREKRSKKQIQTAERVRNHRARQSGSNGTCNDVTPCNATERKETPVTTEVEEEAEVEEDLHPTDEGGAGETPSGRQLTYIKRAVIAQYNEVAARRGWAKCSKIPTGKAGSSLTARCRDPVWVKQFPEVMRKAEALDWMNRGTIRLFTRPDTARMILDEEWKPSDDDSNREQLYNDDDYQSF